MPVEVSRSSSAPPMRAFHVSSGPCPMPRTVLHTPHVTYLHQSQSSCFQARPTITIMGVVH
eukprot:scaffold254403_cov41-Tisochrysis_lutea.AAC.1